MSCERCNELLAIIGRLEDANAELGRQVAGLEQNLRRAGSAEVALRNELNRVREEEPDSPAVKRLLVLWRDLCKDGHKGTSLRLDGPRATRVKWALKRYSEQRIEHAIRGAALDRWAMGRDPRTKGRTYNDIAKHILKDEETVERFEELWLARERGERRTPPRATPDGPTGIAAILDRLEAVREQRPGQWVARCPAHEDRHASLSVAQGRLGAVVHCHAGCTAAHIAAAAGVAVGALFDPEPAAPVKATASKPAPLPDPDELRAMIDRLHASPRVLERLRELRGWTPEALRSLPVGFDGKRLVLLVHEPVGRLVHVRRSTPTPQRGERKLLALAGRPRDLWPRPESVDGDTVWLVEGEPDAIGGRVLGLPAVAVPGANGWRTGWAGRLEGRRVVVCMDCDGPGRLLAGRVAADLAGVAREVRVLDLDESRVDGFDLGDALLGGVSGDGLRARACGVGVVARIGREAA